MKKIFSKISHFCLVAGVIATGTLVVCAADGPKMPSALCVAHRGFSSQFPENTVASMKGGIEAGTNGNELDVRKSADGVIYLMHDGSLKRYTGEEINPSTLTMAELRKRDVGAFKGEKFRGEPVATMDEVVALHVGTGTAPVVELKDGGIEADVLAILKKYDMVDKSLIIAFSASACKKMRELDENIFIAWLCTRGKEETNEAYGARIIKTCADCKINAVDMEHSAVTPELVKMLKDAGLTVMCWTVNNEDRMRACLEAGVDSVTTDCPDKLLKVIAEMKK